MAASSSIMFLKMPQSRFGARRKQIFVQHPADRRPHAQLVLQPVLLDLLDGALADSTRRRVDDAQQADRIVRAGEYLQIGQRILHFGALIETESAHHHIFAAVAPQRFFDLPRLEIGAIQHRRAIVRVGRQQLLDGIGDKQRLLLAIERFETARSFRPLPESVHSHLPLRSVLLATTALAASRIFFVER